MKLSFPLRIYQDPDEPEWWIAEIRGLCSDDDMQTCGDSPEDARRMANDLLSGFLGHQAKKGEDMTPPDSLPDGDGWEWISPEPHVEVAIMIRHLRQEMGLSQKEAAHRLGIPYTSYQRWENPAKCNVTLRTLERVAQAFGRGLEIAFR